MLLAVPAAPEDWRFRRLGSAEGLSQNSVYSLAQDRSGFVWIGTQDGLNRFDGDRFEAFRSIPYETGGLAHGWITTLLSDRSGVLLVGTIKGLSNQVRGDAFERLLTGRSISALCTDPANQLFVGTQGHGLFRVQPDRKAFVAINLSEDGSTPPIHSLACDSQGEVWVGLKGWLGRVRGEKLEKTLAAPAPDLRISALAEDEAGKLWIGTEGGLFRLSADRVRLDRFRHDPNDPGSLSDDRVTLLSATENRLWIGTEGGGLNFFNGERFQVLRHDPTNPESLSSDIVRSLAIDRTGLIWVGTALGVTLIDTRPVFAVERAFPPKAGGLTHDFIRVFAEGPSGELLIGTDGGGVFQRDAEGSHQPFERLPAAERRIWSMLVDRRGRLWIGAQSGLFRFDSGSDAPKIFRHDPGDPNSLAAGTVRGFAEDGDGRVWVAIFGGGLARISGEGDAIESFRATPQQSTAAQTMGLPSDQVLTVLQDRRRQLWIGTAEGLVRRTADGRFHHYRHDPADRVSLLGDVVRTLLQDRAGNLWVGTDAGLNRLAVDSVEAPPSSLPVNNRGFTHFTEDQGLPNNTIYGLVEDQAGLFWLSTNRGLARFDPASGRVRTFDLEDGLQGLEFNGGAALRARDGRLFFGGVRGYNHFRPDELAEREAVPPVVFTEIRVLGGDSERISVATRGEHLALTHRDVAVAVEFAALDFRRRASRRFAYRLLGRDPEWHELGIKRDLTLTGLPAGDYTLEVRATDDGAWSALPARLEIEVAPPPWRSAWAYLGYGLIGALSVAVVARELRRRQALRQEIIEVTQKSEQRLRLALLGSGDGLWDWNVKSNEILRSNIAELFGYRAEELPGAIEFRRRFVHPDDQKRAESALAAHLGGETSRFEAEYRVKDRLGRWRWILDRGNIVERDAQGQPLRMAGTFKDMSQHKEAEAKLRLWSTVFECIDEGVIIIDPAGEIQAVNPAFCRLTGYRATELLGQSMSKLESPEYPPEHYQTIRRALEEEGRWQGELRQIRKGGGFFLAWLDFNAVRDEQGRLTHFVALFSDITRRKESEEELRYLANYDVLTGLPNRTLFQQKLETALAEARHHEKMVALIFGDLDQFKQVNDTLGHAVGDLLLQETSRRLLASVRRIDTVARLGGDEFTVLLHEVAQREVVVRVAERILRSFGSPFIFDGQEIDVTTSLGISLFPHDGHDGQTLLKHADTAMYEAKASGRNSYLFYTEDMSTRAYERVSLESRLRRAVLGGELRLVYQPKLDLKSWTIKGVEALLRWQAGEDELLAPAAFIEIAEETGLIVPIGEWVLHESCRQAQAWRQEGLPDLQIAVNVSAIQLADIGFARSLEQALQVSGLEARHLIVELTESGLMDSSDERIALLDWLKAMGVEISIDDFGTGYSSLSYLKRLPIHEVKIDRSFLTDLSKDDAIVRAIVAMAQSLNLRVVAEGVETVEQLEILTRDGCTGAQGFLIGKPMAAEAIAELVRQGSAGLPTFAGKRTRARRPRS